MAQQTVETTDTLNQGRVKINENFTELYSEISRKLEDKTFINQSSHTKSVGDVIARYLDTYNSATHSIEEIWGVVQSVTDTDNYVIQSIISGQIIYGLPVTTDVFGQPQKYYIQNDGTISTVVTNLPLGIAFVHEALIFSRVSFKGFENPMTTEGDLIVADIGGVPFRLAVGTEGQVLKVVDGIPQWANP